MKFITSLALLLIASVGMAQGVPNTFTAGTPARAAEVNENFSNLDTRVNSASDAAAQAIVGITVMESEIVEGEGFAQVSCPAGMTAISANCVCLGDGVTSNYGMLSLCASGDDGTGTDTQIAVAACDIDFTYDAGLPFPQTGVTAICIGTVNASSAAVMKSAKEELAAIADYQASMGKPTSAVQLRKAVTSKHK